MEIEKFTSLTQLPSSGVQKRTLKGLCGRLKQVEGRVDAAYKGLNDAVDGKMAGILALHMGVVEKQISALQSEIATLRNQLAGTKIEIPDDDHSGDEHGNDGDGQVTSSPDPFAVL